MDIRSKLLSVHVLNSKLGALGPPMAVRDVLANWIREMEQQVRGGGIVSDDVNVADHAEVELINVRGPKQ